MITITDIQAARSTIGSFIHKTPLIHSNSLSRLSGADVYLKLENLQKTGSFKVRGAFNKMTHIKEQKVIAASMGNHAQAVAFASHVLGKSAKIVMPAVAPIVKEEATRGYGAEVVLVGDHFREALEFAIDQKDYYFIHPYDDEDVIAGQGTIAVEIFADLSDIDALFVPVGGGGLIGGIATAVKSLSPRTAVIGVQTGSAPSAVCSFAEKKIVEQMPAPTIADGIAINKVGERTFDLIVKYVDEMMTVEENSIAQAILLFLERKKLVVEGAGAVPLAALMENRARFQNKRVVLVLSGGNIDFTIIDRIVRKGLVTAGRIGVFDVIVDDIAGSLNEVTGIVASHRANVIDIVHDRLAANLPFGKARVIVTAEIRGREHLGKIFLDLAERGYEAKDRMGK
jgi:threonine dehydratase